MTSLKLIQLARERCSARPADKVTRDANRSDKTKGRQRKQISNNSYSGGDEAIDSFCCRDVESLDVARRLPVSTSPRRLLILETVPVVPRKPFFTPSTASASEFASQLTTALRRNGESAKRNATLINRSPRPPKQGQSENSENRRFPRGYDPRLRRKRE